MKNRSNGTKIRIEKNRSYTAMSNYHLFDRSLSFKAKGLLSFMLCVPDTWEFSVKGLAAMAKDGIDSITTSLKELENCGYVKRRRRRNEKGQVSGTEYIIYEKPVNVAANSMFAEEDDETKSVSYDYTESESFKPFAEEKQNEFYNESYCNYCFESEEIEHEHTEINLDEPFLAEPVMETPIREIPVQAKSAFCYCKKEIWRIMV
ncbi:MAG: helix-turn-helix domain-containing protein [Clostridiales bacterium]|nr:helix-turn-helix domain-containing protein [Clostridiales bacterium]